VTGPAPLSPYDGLPHKRWAHFTEYGNRHRRDMCVHMLDTAAGCSSSARQTHHLGGGIFVQKDGKSNISDTQTATLIRGFDRWQHRTGARRPIPIILGPFHYGEKARSSQPMRGTSSLSTQSERSLRLRL